MDINELWQKALKQTEIVRSRIKELATFDATHLPYIFLSESQIHAGNSVVRKGEIVVDKPMLVLPQNSPQFDGFEFEESFKLNEQTITNFLLVRGITFPSLKYNNTVSSLDVYEGKLKEAIKYHLDVLQRKEDVRTGLIVGPDDCWQFSVLVFICLAVSKSANTDIRKFLDKFMK